MEPEDNSSTDSSEEENSVITITFADRGENSVGMQLIGEEQECIFTYEYLKELGDQYSNSEFVDLSLHDKYKGKSGVEPACILIFRNYIPKQNSYFNELVNLDWDSFLCCTG